MTSGYISQPFHSSFHNITWGKSFFTQEILYVLFRFYEWLPEWKGIDFAA